MPDVLVIGGGIVGLLSAFELTLRRRKVVVVDAFQNSPPASWAGGGILSPLYAWRYPDAMTQLTVDAMTRIRRLLGVLATSGSAGIAGLLHEGGMWVQAPPAERDKAHAWAERWGVLAESRTAGSLMAECAAGEGLFFPELGNIRNPRLLKLLRAYLIRKGVRFESAMVCELQLTGKGIRVKSQDGRTWLAGKVLISAGYAVQDWLPSLDLDLFPAKGEMLLYRMQPSQVPAVMLTEAGYLIPRNDGAVLVGSTLRKGDRSPWPTVAGRYQLESLASSLWPALATCRPAHHWAGIRPGCGRNFPYLGKIPDVDGVFLAAGHYRNGLVSAPASAELLAQLICEEPPFIDPIPYSLPESSRSSSSFFKR